MGEAEPSEAVQVVTSRSHDGQNNLKTPSKTRSGELPDEVKRNCSRAITGRRRVEIVEKFAAWTMDLTTVREPLNYSARHSQEIHGTDE